MSSINPEDHLNLVWSLARKRRIRYPQADVEDLFQWGFVGLLHAAQNFKPERGLQFSTYASRCILGQMMFAVYERDWAPKATRVYRKKHNIDAPRPHTR